MKKNNEPETQTATQLPELTESELALVAGGGGRRRTGRHSN